MRRRLEQQGFGADHGFRWRGGDISRLEGLADAVFAFAVTLLVVSLEVPETYLRAHRLADILELTTYERLTTRSEIQGFAINVVIGLTSTAIVAVGGPGAAFWSGMVYLLIMPLQVMNGRVMGGRIRQAFATSPQA